MVNIEDLIVSSWESKYLSIFCLVALSHLSKIDD